MHRDFPIINLTRARFTLGSLWRAGGSFYIDRNRPCPWQRLLGGDMQIGWRRKSMRTRGDERWSRAESCNACEIAKESMFRKTKMLRSFSIYLGSAKPAARTTRESYAKSDED